MRSRSRPRDEAARLTKLWHRDGKPDLWFTYHPYYKAPDLIGPELASAFAVPYVTAEASYSRRRNAGLWADSQGVGGASRRTGGAEYLLHAKGSPGTDRCDSRRRTRHAFALHRHIGIPRHAVTGLSDAPRYRRHDAPGRQSRKLSHAGASARLDRPPALDHVGRRRRTCPRRGQSAIRRLVRRPYRMAWRDRAGRRAGCPLQRGNLRLAGLWRGLWRCLS